MGSITAGTITGGTIRTAASGARVLLDTDKLVCYDSSATPKEVFKSIITGDDVGDVILGDYAGNKGVKWDNSVATLDIKGALSFTYASAQTRKYQTPPAAFAAPEDFSHTDLYSHLNNRGHALYIWEGYTYSGQSLSVYAPISLPNDSIVTKMKSRWECAGDGTIANLSLLRHAHLTGTTQTMAQITSDDTSCSPQGGKTIEDSTISYATIDNDAYYYYYKITFTTSATSDEDFKFKGVELEYTVTTPLP